MARLLIGNVKGPQGDQGEQGVQGVPGNAATVSVGSTTTSAYGTQARVTNSGTQSNAILDFVIPQGAPGEEVTEVGELTVDAITASQAEYPTYTVGEKMKVVLGKQAKYLNDLKTAAAAQSIDISEINTRLIELAGNVLADGSGAHNSIYRGKYLGDHVTAEQWAAIAAGTFRGLYIGDYWVINGVNWRIASFDYYLMTGDTACNTHHVTIVPDTSLYNAKMNDSNVTTGGYTGSAMYITNLADAKTAIDTAFGSAHILSHRQYLCNAVTNGKPSGITDADSKIELMTEENVYGCKIFGAINDGSTVPAIYTIDKSQFPLFALDPHMQSNRQIYWLRDVVSATGFALVDAGGSCTYNAASNARGVRPAFSIKS